MNQTAAEATEVNMLGAYAANEKSKPATKPATGKVIIHERKHHDNILQLTALNFPLHKPTAAVAPVIQ